ncbi:MAG: RNA polymerase sigma factor [Dehalococcoidia bacterium]
MTASTQSTDSVLVQAARGGDEAAFGVLVARHRPMALALCARLLGDLVAAEDAVQEAFLQGFLHLDALRAPSRFGPWLAGIGLNVCRRWLRRRSRDPASYDGLVDERRLSEPVDWSAVPEELVERADVATRVRQAVLVLPRGQQAAVRLYYLAGLTLAETAAYLGVAPNAVKARLFQARSKLARQLQDLWRDVEAAAGSGGERHAVLDP